MVYIEGSKGKASRYNSEDLVFIWTDSWTMQANVKHKDGEYYMIESLLALVYIL